MTGDEKKGYSERPPYPSQSLRPGPSRALAMLIADPGVWVVRIVIAIAEGITRAILTHLEKRKAKREVKADEKRIRSYVKAIKSKRKKK